MAEREALKKLHMRRGYLKGQLTRFINFLRTCEENMEFLSQLQARLDTIKHSFSEFNNIQIEIEYSDETSQEEAHMQEREEFETKYFSAVGLASEILQKQADNVSQHDPLRLLTAHRVLIRLILSCHKLIYQNFQVHMKSGLNFMTHLMH